MIELHATVTRRGVMPQTLEGALKLFGYEKFSPEQEILIKASLEERDVLGVLRTGSGKSACYQVPGILARHRTLVVSPLIALQYNQVLALRKLGVKAWMLNSNMSDAQKMAVYHYYKVASRSEPSFLYISPELLMTEMFHEKFDHVGFERIAVDEAHCVSTWGDSFRPDYQRIRVAVQRLMIPICSAFTATVDKKIEADIRKRIPLRQGFLKVTESPLRSNLHISIQRTSALKSPKLQTLLNRILVHPQYQGPTIIYFNSIDGVVKLYLKIRELKGYLKETGYTPYLFHSRLGMEDKDEALKGFLNDEKPLMIATSAFGMGIDRANVRQIIHYKEPRHLIEYAQQIGRGGRDGLPCLCTTLFNLSGNQGWREEGSVERDVPTYNFIEKVLDNLLKTLSRMSKEKSQQYNISNFRNRTLKWLWDKSNLDDYQCRVYESRFLASLAFLQRAGYIFEDEGLKVRTIVPGTKRHETLIELTQMHKRTMLREQERVTQFFEAKPATQELLWEILTK